MSKVSELFEKISHPTRVKILKLLEASPLTFSQLKNKLGIESSGNLDHYLKKLKDLILLDSDGLYKISNEGKSPGEILSLEQDNFEIPYYDILSVTLHKGLLRATIEFEAFREGEWEKLKFGFSSKQFSDARKTARKVLNDKLKATLRVR